MTKSRLLMAAAFASLCAAQPRFEVASIKLGEPGGANGEGPARIDSKSRNSRSSGFERLPGGGLRMNGGTVQLLIRTAYNLQDYQISGGPSWITNLRFNIEARPEAPDPPGDSKAQFELFRQRIKTLLEERFQLKVRAGTKEASVYVLTVEKNGHKMKLTEQTSGGIRQTNRGELEGIAVDMELLAMRLAMTVRNPVLDQTGLSGKFAFKLSFGDEGSLISLDKPGEPPPPPTPDETRPSIFTAVQQQLGLRLQSQKGPVAAIVIERIEKPSEN